MAPADADASTRQSTLARDTREAPVHGGCLRHTLQFLEDFLFSSAPREELSTMGTWR
jgi:hypothetical protein